MKVLVTGVAGRVGSGVWREIAPRHRVRGLDLAAGDAHEMVVGDMMDRDTRRRAAEGMDAIVHLAFFQKTRGVAGSYELNAHGTYLMLETALEMGVPRLVYASTLSVFGPQQWQDHGTLGRMSEEVPPEPYDVYGLTKLLGEQACHLFARHGLRCTILRLTGVTLPENWGRVVEGRWGSATHVADVAQGFRLALEHDPPEGVAPIYHLCGDHPNKPTPITRARAGLGFEPIYNLEPSTSAGKPLRAPNRKEASATARPELVGASRGAA